jgi:hypothetical protein
MKLKYTSIAKENKIYKLGRKVEPSKMSKTDQTERSQSKQNGVKAKGSQTKQNGVKAK